MLISSALPEFHIWTGGATTTPAPAGASRRLYQGAKIKADAANTAALLIGDTPGNCVYPLAAGEETFVPVDDAAKVFVASESSTATFYVLAA